MKFHSTRDEHRSVHICTVQYCASVVPRPQPDNGHLCREMATSAFASSSSSTAWQNLVRQRLEERDVRERAFDQIIENCRWSWCHMFLELDLTVVLPTPRSKTVAICQAAVRPKHLAANCSRSSEVCIHECGYGHRRVSSSRQQKRGQFRVRISDVLSLDGQDGVLMHPYHTQ